MKSPNEFQSPMPAKTDIDAFLTVVHVGVLGEEPGGMAQVVNQYLSWTFSRCRVIGLKSTRGRRDVSSMWLTPLCILRMAGMKFRIRNSLVAVIHMSQRGSFLREGLIALVCRIIRVPLAIHIHGSDFASFAAAHPLLTRTVLRFPRTVFVLTEETRRIVAGATSAGTAVVVVPNAVKMRTGPLRKENIVTFGGEVGLRKGVDTLVKAWEGLPDSLRLAWRLEIAGPCTADGSALMEHLPSGVNYAGKLQHSELMDLLDRSRVAVLPSRHEALPMFLIEAMAVGCVPIGTSVGNVATLVQDAGVVILPDDAAALQGTLEQVLSPEFPMEAVSHAARERIRNTYSSETVAKVLEAEWMSLANDAAGDRA